MRGRAVGCCARPARPIRPRVLASSLRDGAVAVSWLEYLGGRADAVAELVGRLELEPGDDTQTGGAAAG
jgi:hypothetical protein